MKRLLLILAALALAPAAFAAAPVVNLTPSVGAGNVVTLTWSTVPAATSCTASGSWSGAKAASGTLNVGAISATAKYDLACSFSGETKIHVTWGPATQNTDGSAYTDAKSVRVVYALGAANPVSQDVDVSATAVDLTGLSSGTYTIQALSVSTAGATSALSVPVTATLAAATTGATSATVTVPKPPTGVTCTVLP